LPTTAAVTAFISLLIIKVYWAMWPGLTGPI
jgi:hypothetical protein